MKRLSKEEFINRAKCILGDNYSFEKTNYIDAHHKIIITCKIHGDFEVEPSNILNHNTGCPYCKGEKISRAKRSNTLDFINKAKKIHGDKYDYSLVDYKHSQINILIVCPTHGIFEQTPNNHLKGEGCPKCKNLKK